MMIYVLIGLFVYYPSAWLYNFPSKHTQININNDETRNSHACNNNNGSVRKEEDIAKNEMNEDAGDVIIRTTCDVGNGEERIMIVNENLQTNNSRSLDERKCSMSDANTAIELLDTILEAATKTDELQLSDSITSCIVEESTSHHEEEISSKSSETESHATRILNEINRNEIESEIDEILRQAVLAVAKLDNEKIKINNDEDDDHEIESENIFKNHKFLSHLNDLISNPNPVRTLNRAREASVNMSKTLSRKKSISTNEKVTLKRSHSFSDLTTISDAHEVNKFNDEKLQDPDKENAEVATSRIPVPPPEPTPSSPSPAVTKFISARKKPAVKIIDDEEVKELDTEKTPQPTVHENENNVDESSVTLNRVNIRDKLEKLLQSAPMRFSRIPPTPLPRTIINSPDIHPSQTQIQTQSLPHETPPPMSATMQKQKMLFNEVLKTLKHENDEIIKNVA